LATPARADPIPIPITITSGTIDVFSPTLASGALRLFGTGGFSITAGLSEGAFQPGGCCLEGGQTARFSGNWIGSSLSGGTVTYRGESFTDIGGANSANQASVTFTSNSFVVPPAPTGGATTTIVESFTLSGMFRGAPGDGHFAVPTLFTTFSGSGVGRLSLVSTPLSSNGPFVWQARDAHLDIMAPTPEPTSLLLLGLGAAGIWVIRRRNLRPAD
jgi:hypothetical protein